MEERTMKKIVIDFNVDIPVALQANIAAIIADYMHLLRFTIGIAQVSVYPLNTKIVQNPISLEGNLSDVKH